MLPVPKRTSLFLAAAFLLLSACAPIIGPAPASPPQSDVNLEDTQWQFEGFLEAGQETPALAGTNVTLLFQNDNQAVGNAGCNSYGGSYQIAGRTIAFSDIFSTRMFCEGQGIMDQEQRYLEALSAAGAFEQVNDRLEISYADGQATLNFVRISP